MLFAQFLVVFADIVTAGRIHRDVQASLGIISVSIFIFLVLATAISNGAVSIISQSLGAQRRKRAGMYAVFVLSLGLVFGLGFTVIFSLFKTSLLALLNTPESILPITEYFLDIYLFTLPAYYLLLTTNGIFQAYKDVRLPLYSMCLVSIINGVLDFGLGLGMWGIPNFGYKGVAWATFCSIGAGAALNLYNMFRKRILVLTALPPTRWIKHAWPPLLKYAWPAGTTHVLWQGSILSLYILLGMLPGDQIGPLAGFATGMRLEAILFMPAFALNLTAAILVGRDVGAGNREQAYSTALRILGLGVTALSFGAVIFWIMREPLATLIAPDPIVRDNTLNYLIYSLSATPFTVGAMILGGVMTGAGATLYIMLTFGLAGWVVRLPLAWLLSQWYGANGIWCALLLSHIIHGLCLLYVFLRLNWQGFAIPARHRTPGK